MRRDDVIKLLQSHQEELKKYGVRSLALFGSVVRDEARPDSDVDVMVVLEDGATLFDYGGLVSHLEDLLGTDVDVVEEQAVIGEIRANIRRDAVNVF
ncbi:MAG: nucleotidyltransferase family protein [Chloroflexi bacterium]|nr:nucleotidyltransferase family protein [Chloroflexota bacterium]